MASTIIRTNSSYPDWVGTYQIAGRLYRIRAMYDDRNEGWFLSIGTQTDWLIQGEAARAGQQIFNKTIELLPSGQFSLLDLDGDGDPGRDDLGVRVLLMYKDDLVPLASTADPVTVVVVP